MNAIVENLGRLPVAVIGAGPVGLAAAAHLIERGMGVTIYERATAVAGHIRDWGHVRLFSPWAYNIDAAARRLLESSGWTAPAPLDHPTGDELIERYLEPLARTREIAAVTEYGAEVVAIARAGHDKMKTAGRAEAPFVLTIRERNGKTRLARARAVIDCSGSWSSPNPIGIDGFAVPGELEHEASIRYGIPDVLGKERGVYADRRVLVVGAGHSAANVMMELATLAAEVPATRIFWAVRGEDLSRLVGGGAKDQLVARGALGQAIDALSKSGRTVLKFRASVSDIALDGDALAVSLDMRGAQTEVLTVDRIVVATGQRPRLDFLREIRLDLDPATESARALAPLIDPNIHSCGTVRPHGYRELAQPEPGFTIAGVKSYGRAPTFLLATGYEQVRSIAAALGGDMAAADEVKLALPASGVCGGSADGTDKPRLRISAPATQPCCAPSCCGDKQEPKQEALQA